MLRTPRTGGARVLAGKARVRLAAVLAATAVLAAVASPATAAQPRGIDWPARQLLPHFAAVRSLDVLDAGQVSGDERMMLATLQGIVNRTEPRIYLVENADEGTEAWPSTFSVPQRRFTDPWALVSKYRSAVRGIVIYDPAQPDSINVATTIAGLRDALVASPSVAERLRSAPYDLPVVDDLRGRFSSHIDAYEWAYKHLWKRTTHRMLVGISPRLGEAFRFVDGNGQATYGFDVPAGARELQAKIEMWNEYEVSATTVAPDQATDADWQVVAREDREVRDATNRRTYTVDLSRFAGASRVYLRFRDSFPQDGWGPGIRSVSVTADGATVASFTASTPAESSYLVSEQGSQVSGVESYGLLRDYAVANRAMVVYLDTGQPADRALFEKMLSQMPANGAYAGWFPADVTGENAGVELASRHGIITVPSDLSSSMTVMSAREPIARAPRRAARPTLQNRVYVSFFMTEGDNLQYNQHTLRRLWDDPARGSVPISWSMSPLLLDAGQHMLNHYLTTATPNDYLMAGPSGAGYVYPTPYPDDAFREYAKLSGDYMRRAGMRGLYALNRVGASDVSYEPQDARAVERFMRPQGVVLNLYFGAPFSNAFMPSGTPLTSGPIAQSVAQAKQQIADATTGWDGRSPRFVSLGVLSWSMTPTQLAQVASSLPATTQVVRGDELFALMRKEADRR